MLCEFQLFIFHPESLDQVSKRTPFHVTAVIAAYESDKTVIHFGSFTAFNILFIVAQ